MVPEKENWIRMKKDISTELGQLVKAEVGLWIDYKGGNCNDSSFGVYVLVP